MFTFQHESTHLISSPFNCFLGNMYRLANPSKTADCKLFYVIIKHVQQH
jgi:hypothetical protein